MSEATLARDVEAVRRFSRFYTRRIGVLHEGLLDSEFSLAEGRVLYDLAHQAPTTARALADALDLDPGYLSRLLKGLDKRGLIKRRPSAADGRQQVLSLSAAGDAAFAAINARSQHHVGTLLAPLSPAERGQLVEAVAVIERLLGPQAPRQAPYILRPHQPGDIGWVIERHAVLYAQEYG